MAHFKYILIILSIFILASLACYTTTLFASPTVTVTTAASNPSTTGFVRACEYIPGKSIPAQIPPNIPQPVSTSTPMSFANSPVDKGITSKQMDMYNQIVKDINDYYVYPDFNGKDWLAIQNKYKDLIQKGLKQADFYQAMNQMVNELGDEYSYFLSPEDQQSQTNSSSSSEFVGIGVHYTNEIQGQAIHVLTWVFPGSPAEKAGLKSHDLLLKVDGGPFLDQDGNPRTLGPEGSSFTLTVQTPGQPARDVKLVRTKVNSSAVVDDCLVTGTKIGYIRWPSTADPAVLDQTVKALKQMGAVGPLKGLVIDDRLDSDHDQKVLRSLLGLFTSGELGNLISPHREITPSPYMAEPVQDISGSQKIPLVVLEDQTTLDAPFFGGTLQLIGRARIVGQPSPGIALRVLVFKFSDGSALHLVSITFQPQGKTAGFWEKTGVIPDVTVNGRWDQFTEANDPYLAKAVELLTP